MNADERINELLECNTRLVNERRAATMLRDEVRAFHRLADQHMPEVPTAPTMDVAVLRLLLVLEEVGELCEAMGYAVEAAQLDSIRAFLAQNPRTPRGFDMVKTADALADVAFVTEGSFSTLGIDSQPILREVCRSNKSKTPFTRDPATGKIKKGPEYSPPDLAPILEAMGWRP